MINIVKKDSRNKRTQIIKQLYKDYKRESEFCNKSKCFLNSSFSEKDNAHVRGRWKELKTKHKKLEADSVNIPNIIYNRKLIKRITLRISKNYMKKKTL